MPLKSAPLYGTSCHSRPSFSAMRCISAMSKPAGPSLVMNSNGGSGNAAPTFKAGAALALRAPNTSVASNGKAASKWRRIIVRCSSMGREPKASPAALRAKFVRRGAGLLAEKPCEVGRIGKRQFLGNVVDRLRGEDELALGFGEDALADQMAGGDAGRAFDVVVEPVDGHTEFFRIELELALDPEILVDQSTP